MGEKIDWCKVLDWGEDQIEDLRATGYSYIRQGKYDIANKFFKALTTLDRGNAYDLQMLGAISLEKQEPYDALDYFDRALEIEPDHSKTQVNRAKALFGIGRKEEGMKLVKRLLKHSDSTIVDAASALMHAYR